MHNTNNINNSNININQKPKIKFLVLGITGNLAQLKILPAVGQFTAFCKDNYEIELIGYSRSKADIDQIREYTNQDECNLPKIILEQGQYDNFEVYHNLVSELRPQDRLIVYLAVPPSVYKDFIESSCQFGSQKIDVLIEKPFGENKQEALRIINIIKKCKIQNRVRFIDHYLFKNSTRINFGEALEKFNNNEFCDIQNLKKIKIRILETLGVEGRGGYYDTIGARRDMLVHLYSLLKLTLKNLCGTVRIGNVELINQKTSQYEGYDVDIGISGSKTETYFEVVIKIELIGQDRSKIIIVELESGKKQIQKITDIEIDFETNSSNIQNINWQIQPESLIICDNKNFFDNINIQNFTKKINFTKKNNLDHTNVFEDLINNQYAYFVDYDEVIEGWNIINKIILN